MAEPMTLWGLLGRILLHGQKFLVYPSGFEPHPRLVRNPHDENLDYELLQLPTPDGATIHCHLMLFSSYKTWRFSESSRTSPKYARDHRASMYAYPSPGKWDSVPANGRATVVMFHGNAMNHGDIIDLAEKFMWRGCNVVTVSYRGYGESTGTPSESGLRTDAQTVLDFLTKHEALSSVPIVVWGQSLGAAVAIDLVHKNVDKVAALIVENAFLSIPLLVRDFPQPFASLSFLCTQRWPSIERIQKIPKSIPILMLGGDADQVIPPKHLQGLWAGAQLRPEARPSERVGHTASGSENNSAEPVSKEMHRKMDSDGYLVGCLPSATPRKKNPIKGGSDILKSLNVMSGDVELRSGKDRYRLFAYGRHENTCRNREYWPTIGDFLDEIFGPCSSSQQPRNRTSALLTGTITKRDSLPPSTSYAPPEDAASDTASPSSGDLIDMPSKAVVHDPKISAFTEAHIPMDLPPLPTPVTSPTFAPLSAASMTSTF